MKSKSHIRKLSLHRETLRTLAAKDLEHVVGGDVVARNSLSCDPGASQVYDSCVTPEPRAILTLLTNL